MVRYDFRRKSKIERLANIEELKDALKTGRYMLIDAPLATSHASKALASILIQASVSHVVHCISRIIVFKRCLCRPNPTMNGT